MERDEIMCEEEEKRRMKDFRTKWQKSKQKKEWMMVCVMWCMLFWDSSWTTNTLVLIKRKRKKPVWGERELAKCEDKCIVCELRERGTSVLLQTEWCGRIWVFFFFLLPFFSCKPVMGRKSVSDQCQYGTQDSPHFPQALCSQKDDGTLVTSKCTPYQPPTPHPLPANPTSFCSWRLYRVPSWMKVAFFWCLVQLLNVQCVRELVDWQATKKLFRCPLYKLCA